MKRLGPIVHRAAIRSARMWLAGGMLTCAMVGMACDARKDPEADKVATKPVAPSREVSTPEGSLYMLGDDVACLEFALDPKAGAMVVRVWNAQRTKRLPLHTQWLEIQLAPTSYDSGAPARGRSTLLLMPDPDRWAKTKRASEFFTTAPKLRGLESFVAIMGELTVSGKDFTGVEIRYPAEGIVYTREDG